MIKGNINKIEGLNQIFQNAIRQVVETNLVEGRNDIDGDNVYAIFNECVPKRDRQDAPLEVHNRYIDIQIILFSEETFGYADRAKCQNPSSVFDTQKDILFFDDAPSEYFTLKEDEFVVFFPEDAHAPLIGEGEVKKIIIKIDRFLIE